VRRGSAQPAHPSAAAEPQGPAPAEYLRAVARRLRLRGLLVRASAVLLVAGAALLGLRLLESRGLLARAAPWQAAAALALAAVALVPLAARRPDEASAARLLDRRLGFEERASTWLELSARASPSPFAPPIGREVAALARRLPPSSAVPLAPTGLSAPAAALGAVLAVAAFLPRGGAAEATPRAADIARAEAARLREAALPLAGVEAADLRALRSGLEALAADLDAGRLDADRLRALLDTAERARTSTSDSPGSPGGGPADLAGAADLLRSLGGAEAVEGDPEAAARRLLEASRDDEALRPRLAADPSLARVAEALRRREAESLAAALRDLATRLRRAAILDGVVARLEASARRLGTGPAAGGEESGAGSSASSASEQNLNTGGVYPAGPTRERADGAGNSQPFAGLEEEKSGAPVEGGGRSLPPELAEVVRRYFAAP